MSRKASGKSAPFRDGSGAPPEDVLEKRIHALKGSVVFSEWPDQVLLRLAEKSRMESIPAGVAIQSVGHPIHSIHVLVRGATQSGATDSHGRRVSLKLHKPGDVHGLFLWAAGPGKSRFDLMTLVPSTLLVIPVDAMQRTLAAEPLLWQSLAIEASRRILEVLELALSFGLEPPGTRFARHILHQLESAEPERGGALLKATMSQQMMADLLGVSRPTVVALVRGFEAQGLIRWHYGRISILDIHRLQEVARVTWAHGSAPFTKD